MRLWRIATATDIAPFHEQARDTFVYPNSLARSQETTCHALDIELLDVADPLQLQVGPGLVLFDNTFVNTEAVRHLQNNLLDHGGSVLCHADDALFAFVAPGTSAHRLENEHRPLGLFYTPTQVSAADAKELRHTLAQQSMPVYLPQASSFDEPLPKFGPNHPHLVIPRANAIAANIESWIHLLWLNQVIAYAVDSARQSGTNKNFIAQSAHVHPTAYVERSIIGADVSIEPHATIIDTVLAARCHIADHSSLIGCALGDSCQTLVDTNLRRVVAFPHATLSNLGLEECLVGRGAFLTTAAIFFPTTLGETISVDIDGTTVDTGRPRLSGCIGHGAVLGARAIFAPGRVVANGYTIVMRPEEGVGKIDPSLDDGKPACWHEGRLIHLDEVWQDYLPPEIDFI